MSFSIIGFFTFTVIANLMAAPFYSQLAAKALDIVSGQQNITEEFKETPLNEVIGILDAKYGIHISYDPALIGNVKITASLKNSPKDEALKLILKNTQLSLSSVKSNYYSLIPSSTKCYPRRSKFTRSCF